MNKQNDIQLSEHFSLSEFTKSITAERLGIDNKPGYEHILAMRNLCREVLEPLRQHYGHPIRITSGYRCEELNSVKVGRALMEMGFEHKILHGIQRYRVVRRSESDKEQNRHPQDSESEGVEVW